MPMSYAFSGFPVCDDTTTSYWDVTGYLVILHFHLPACWYWLLLCTSVWFWIHHQAPTFTYCWIVVWAIWISGSQIMHHSSDSSVLGKGMLNFASIFLIICPVLLTIILPESYTIQLWFKHWVRLNTSFIPKISPSLLIPVYLEWGITTFRHISGGAQGPFRKILSGVNWTQVSIRAWINFLTSLTLTHG